MCSMAFVGKALPEPTSSTIPVPAFGNYAFEAKFDDIEVNPSDPDLDDTHLCACPGWKKPGPGHH